MPKLSDWALTSRPRWLAALGAILILGVAGVFLLVRDEGPPSTDEVTLEVTDRIEVGRAPAGVAASDDSVYVTAAQDLRISRIDLASLELVGDASFGAIPASVALTPDAVWVGFAELDDVLRFDPELSSEPEPVTAGDAPQNLVADGDDVWVAALNAEQVVRIDGSTRAVTETLEVETGFPSGVAVGFDSVWVSDVVENVVWRYPDDGGEPVRIHVGRSPTSVVATEDAVWVGNFGSGTVSRIDPDKDQVIEGIEIGGEIAGMAAGGGYLWVADQDGGRVVAIDLDSNGIAGELEVGELPQGIAYAPDDSVWVALGAEATVARLTFE